MWGACEGVQYFTPGAGFLNRFDIHIHIRASQHGGSHWRCSPFSTFRQVTLNIGGLPSQQRPAFLNMKPAFFNISPCLRSDRMLGFVLCPNALEPDPPPHQWRDRVCGPRVVLLWAS